MQPSDTHHNVLTPGKVQGEDPLFYREKQSQRLCVKHALNAFMGGPVVDRSDLVRIHKERNIENVSNTIQDQITRGHTDARIASDHALSVDLFRQLMAEGGPRQVAEAELAMLAELVSDAHDSEQYVVRGNLMEVALDAINSKKDALGVPAARYDRFSWRDNENDIVAFVREQQGQTDRFAVGSGARYFAFRKAENGNWYLLDSIDDKQQVQSPLEYTQQRISAENRQPSLRVYDLPRFEFVTFPTEVTPRLGNPLPTTADKV